MNGQPIAAPRRADALRNRERILAAAEAEFAEHGLDAGIPEIAARAEVGKGTIYRNFESKDDLIAAIVARRMEEFDRTIIAAIDQPDPFEALRDVLLDAATRTSGLALPVGISWPLDRPELNEARERVKAHLGELFEAAREKGRIRVDARPEELLLLFSGVCRALKAHDETDPAVWRRHADLALDAFRPLRP